VIRSLEVRDLVVIERAELAPPGGLTAITGETGAGKTVLAQALGLLAGAPADSAAVRPGARQALVQATLAVPEGFWDRLEDDDPALALRELAEDENEVVIARRVPAEGRARALIDGQAAPRDAVAALARALVRFSAQHEHRRLVGPASQLAVLDAFAGPAVVAAADRLRMLRRRLAGLERSLAAARARREAAERERADLEELVAAVDAAGPDAAEEAALLSERERLRHAEGLAAAASAAAEALAPEEREGGALDAVGAASAALAPMVPVDGALGAPHAELVSAQAGLQDALLSLRAYLQDLDAEPGRLEVIEERLEAYSRLSRRYGPGTEAVLERAAEAREALRGLGEGAGDVLALAQGRESALDEAVGVAIELREARAEAAPRLAEAVRDELADLAMPKAELRVELIEDEGDPPADSCVIWLRANPGLPEAPLAAAASGGELSRVLLALHGLAAAGDEATWVLDEVDAGIGGVTATAVGARLRRLAEDRQVIVITHLPQVAAMADAHYRLVKGLDGEGRATTRIEPVADEALLEELCRMLGAGSADAGARRHAEELLARRAG
jgi:DNA repair protein RecN (Recombination protein N)